MNNHVPNSDFTVVNAHKGIGNIVDRDNAFKIIIDILDKTIATLRSHCGPMSRYALVIAETGGLTKANIFTKDGANIIRSTTYASPIERYIKELIKYIGDRVDNVSHDGTTTTMLFSCYFLKELLLNYRKQIDNKSTHVLKLDYDIFMKDVLEYLNNNIITIQSLMDDYQMDLQQAKRTIAWIQTMTSSGGNRKLADVISTLFERDNTRTDVETITFYKDIYETSEDFRIEYDDSDFSLDVYVHDKTIFDDTMSTDWKLENCNIIAQYYDAADDSVETNSALKYFERLREEYPDQDPPVVFWIAPEFGASLYSTVQKICNDNQIKIKMIHYTPKVRDIELITGIRILHSIAGTNESIVKRDLLFNDNHVIKNATVELKGNELFLSNLYDKSQVKNGLHPKYTNPELDKKYTTYRLEIESIMDKLKNGHVTNDYQLTAYFKLHQKMTVASRVYFWVGGTTHDHQANIDVVQDCLGAVNAAIKHGLVIGSMLPLMRYNHSLLQEKVSSKKGINIELDSLVIDSAIKQNLKDHINNSAIDEVLENPYVGACIASTTNTQKDISKTFSNFILDLNRDTNQLDIINYRDKYAFMDFTPKKHKEQILNNKDIYVNIDHNGMSSIGSLNEYITKMCSDIYQDNYPITQPSNLYNELFKRIGEVFGKLISIDKILIPNTVYLEDE